MSFPLLSIYCGGFIITNITARTIGSTQPKSSPYFIRDSRLKGFAVKVNTSGSVKFIAEVWQNGRSTRKTLGAYPAMSISDARKEAISFISEVRQGKLKPKKKQLTFIELFEVYLAWLWLLVFG